MLIIYLKDHLLRKLSSGQRHRRTDTHTHTHTADGLLFKVHRHKALGNEMRIRSLSVESKYTVSQKTSHLWLAITFTDVNRLLIILAQILPIKQGIKRHFTIPAQISCASVLSGKRETQKWHFSLAVGLLAHCQNSTSCCLISSVFLTHDSYSRCCMTP